MRLGIEAGADTVAAAIELGIKGVPINAIDLVANGVEATLAPLKKNVLEVCQIGAFGYNPLTEDKAALAEQTSVLEKVIPLAAATGCPYIVICGGNYHPSGFGAWDPRNNSDAAMDEMVSQLEPLVRLAAQHGAKISIEPYLKTAINGPAPFWALRERMSKPEALVANLDVTSHYDYRDFVNPRPRCQEVCEGYAGAYGLGHIKDLALNDGFHLDMGLAPLGSSPTDWSEVLGLMIPNMPSDSWLILEHVSDITEARASVAKLRDFAQKAGVALQ